MRMERAHAGLQAASPVSHVGLNDPPAIGDFLAMNAPMRIFVAAIALALVLDPLLAVAQNGPAETHPRPVIEVEVHQDRDVLDANAVRAAVGRELGADAVPANVAVASPPQGHLTIAIDAERRIVMVYRDATGREILRAVAMPHDPAAAVGMIALLAGNLARNEAQDLASTLGGAPAAVAAPAASAQPAPAAIVTHEATAIAPEPEAVLLQPVMVLPTTVTLPTPAIDARDAGRIGLRATIQVAGDVAQGAALPLDLALDVRWRHVAFTFDLVAGPGLHNGWSGLTWLAEVMPGIAFRWPVGAVRVGFGFSAGAFFNRTNRTYMDCGQCHTEGTGIAVRAVFRLEVPLGPHLDLLAETGVLGASSDGAFLMFHGGAGVQFRAL